MEPQVRKYADALYVAALSEARDEHKNEIVAITKQMAQRGLQQGFSGIALSAMIEIEAAFIGRQMKARLASFQQAFEHASVTPSLDDLQQIWQVVVDAYENAIRTTENSLRNRATRVGHSPVGTDGVQSVAAHHHDKVLGEFNVWRSRVALGPSGEGHIISGANADRKFARLAIDEARKSVPENDGRPHPWVGAVVVRDGKVLGTAHRGEVPGNHAEFVALERNLPDVAVAGATVYTTLEPCTTRNPPKIPCVDRLIERRVARVVIGILDPDERIRGKGQRKLSNAGIETSLFPHDLAMEVEELNRDFTRFCEQQCQTPDPLEEVNRCDFWLAFDPRGSRPLGIQNNGAEPAFDVVVQIPADGSGFNSDVINRLDNDRNWVSCTLKGNFVYLEAVRTILVQTILRSDGEEVRRIPVLITYRTRKHQDCEAHLEIRLPLKNGIQFALPQIQAERSKKAPEELEPAETQPEQALDDKILEFLENGLAPGNRPFTGAGDRLFRASEIADTLSLPKAATVDRLIHLETQGRVRRHDGTLDNSAPYWSILRI